jgi:signal transduction histidine kinase
MSRAVADPALDRMRQAIDDIDDTIRDIRSAIFSLHTRRPGGARLRDDVMGVAHDAGRVLGFEPAVAFDGPVDSAASDSMHEHLIATLREALSNVAKHARATAVTVDVTIERNQLVLSVRDDGRGMRGRPGAGNGLANMSERAHGLGGRCDVTQPGAGGTQVEWRVPIDQSAGSA